MGKLRHIIIFPLLLFLIGGSLSQDDVESAFVTRLNAWVDSSVNTEGCSDFREVLRMHFNSEQYFCAQALIDSTAGINDHNDGVDFRLSVFSWIVNRFWNHPYLVGVPGLKDDIVYALTHLPLWLDDDGYLDTMQYWSENHQIGWIQAIYLIGNGFASQPDLADVVFVPSGLTGAQLRDKGRAMVDKWLEARERFGFSEFNSDTYAPIAYKAVVAVSALAPDADIQRRAQMIQHLMEMDHITGSRETRLATGRGRAYTGGKIGESRYGFLPLLKGVGEPPGLSDGEAIGFTMFYTTAGNAQYPNALLQIASDIENGDYVVKERFGLPTEEGPAEGIGNSPEECIFWFSDGAYFSPDLPECLFVVGDAYDLWERQEVWEGLRAFKPIWDTCPLCINVAGEVGTPFGAGPVLGPINMYTHRTPDFMLSTVQDYHGGWMAGQQHVWQLTFQPDTVGAASTVFSHQPLISEGSDDHSSNYWVGGMLPKVLQFGTTVVSLHNPDLLPVTVFQLEMTHAHLRTSVFDEVINEIDASTGGWIFARQGEGYVGLYTANGASYNDVDVKDLVAPGVQNVWILEAGSQSLNGSFTNFVNALRGSQIGVAKGHSDNLLSCLSDNKCLASGPDALGSCLKTTCRPDAFPNSRLAKCIELEHDENLNLLDNSDVFAMMPDAFGAFVPDHLQLVGCLARKDVGARAQLSVSYVRAGDGRTISAGFNEDFVVDGWTIPVSNYPRYESVFGTVPWGSKTMNFNAGSYYLNMDFAAGTLEFN